MAGSSEFISSVTRFIIYIVMIVSLVMLFTSGGLVAGYSIGIFLILCIITLCSFKDIANLGILSTDDDILTFTWCFPIILLLFFSRQYMSDKVRDITDPLTIILTGLLIFNFSIPMIIELLSFIFMKIVEVGSTLLPFLIGLVSIIAIIGVVFFWDKISTLVKVLSVVGIIILGMLFFNGEDIISYISTNKISLSINLLVVVAFAIVNYVLYKYTENGLMSNVFLILSSFFVLRWLYLYTFKFYGTSGSKTFTGTTSDTTPDGKAPTQHNKFLSYLMDVNFYCDTIKSIFTGTIKYFFIAIFLFYVWFVYYIYYKNSFEFLTTYKTLSLLGFIALGIVMLLLVIYSLAGGKGVKESGPFAILISKIVSYFLGFAVVLGVITYALTKVLKMPSTTVQIISIINFLLMMGLIALILSIFNFNASSPSLIMSSDTGLGFIFNFIVKLVVYIPCLIIDCSNVILEQFNLAKKEYTVFVILLIEIALIAGKFLVPKLFDTVVNHDGIILTDKVYPLEAKRNVTVSPSLMNMSQNTNYGFSCWLYIHPSSPNTNEAYIENTTLINLGNAPNIQFNAQKNSLIFSVDVADVNGGSKTVVVPASSTETDIIINYSKGNHVFVNFRDGNIDIFVNGELVMSSPGVIPYKNPNMLIIGSSPGIYGETCSLVYYKKPLLAENINLLYKTMKNFNPPISQS
uniref:Uncharacterized protein n=1 Tax=viral metagenome TaxID=1070528 RepID=A0A6C0EW40_9ZZZZ